MSRGTLPVVVGGCHRSGTSLLRRMLDAHPRIHCGPEVTFFRDLHGAYFDDPLHHLRFTTTARAIVPADDLLVILGRAFIEVHERGAARAGKPRWADKAPENVLYLSSWEQLLGDAWLFVHVVRNPLDTLASIAEARFPLTIPPDLPGRIAHYIRYTQAGLDFARRQPTRYYRVIYDELVRSPESTLRRLMQWMGEAFAPSQLRFNDMPHEVGLEDPQVPRTAGVVTTSVGRWRSALSPDEVAAIRLQAGDLWAAIETEACVEVAS